MKTIGSVGCEIPGGHSEFVPFDSRACLLDWDIIVFNPSITAFYDRYTGSYRGKPLLSDGYSAALQEVAHHWRRELSEALRAGKNVLVFLPEIEEVYVDTGRREYSGSGRNRETTRIVSSFTNYEMLPPAINVTASEGRAMTLRSEAAFLGDYWRQFAKFSQYRVILTGKIGIPLVATKSGAKTVGTLIRSPEEAGSLVLLPHLDLTDKRFMRPVKAPKTAEPTEGDDSDGEETQFVWTPEGKKFGSQLVAALISIDVALRQSVELTPPPPWTKDPAFVIPKEASLLEELLVVEKKLESLTIEKEQKKREVAKESMLRCLLYEKGPRLEAAIIQGLGMLGLKASRYRDSQSEFDVVFEAAEGRVIGEAEGKDNKPVNIDKLRQLEMNLHEDVARDCVDQMAKGVLFGNAFRFLPPNERPDYFTTKCLSAAKRSGCALVRTPDLFLAAQYLAAQKDTEFARNCRISLMATAGDIVSFPARPDAPPKGKGTEKTREEADS